MLNLSETFDSFKNLEKNTRYECNMPKLCGLVAEQARSRSSGPQSCESSYR